ncbi:MAG: hypothetical protein RBU30_16910, partial [Polyangia bacterium]|nr:hypothetical protein [Polyangia bacterium]
MWLILKTAWRGLRRHRRRTIITVTAMAFSLCLAIPTWGLTEGLTKEMLRGITGMELGHLQLHDPAYPRGKAMQSTLDRPEHLMGIIRSTPGVRAAAPRVHGYALASHDNALRLRLVALDAPRTKVKLGRVLDKAAPWRADPALACEAILSKDEATKETLTVGTVVTPESRGKGGRCERIQIVGISGEPLGPTPEPGSALLALPEADLMQAFGQRQLGLSALVRHSAAVSLMGVDPKAERRVTFMADKIVQGRYLANEPRGEIVVGYRLARIMKLEVGGKLFLQAAALDTSKGTFYRDATVVGIYRTGVEMLDRSRIFLHVKDAQTLMTLGDRVHEIAVTGDNARSPQSLARRLGGRVSSRLRAREGASGTRAGSLPLPAPVTVWEPAGDDAAFLVPYDLMRRFEDIPGVAAVSRRIYAEARVAKARVVSLGVLLRDKASLGRLIGPSGAEPRPCTLYMPTFLALGHGLHGGEVIHPMAAATGQDAGCPRVTVVTVPLTTAAATAASNVPPREGPRALGAPPAPGIAAWPGHQALALDGGTDDGEDPPGLEAGSNAFLVPGAMRPLRLVGVEPSHEESLSGLGARVARGSYFATKGPEADAPAVAPWPALLPVRVAKALVVSPGESL